MTVIEDYSVGVINLVEIDDSSLDEGKALHLWENWGMLGKPAFCGAKEVNHDCYEKDPAFCIVYRGQTHCTGCGKPFCSYCLLLSHGQEGKL